jgi:hypothetical protein
MLLVADKPGEADGGARPRGLRARAATRAALRRARLNRHRLGGARRRLARGRVGLRRRPQGAARRSCSGPRALQRAGAHGEQEGRRASPSAPGLVLPSCVHGGPGRAGGGEELGGERGLQTSTCSGLRRAGRPRPARAHARPSLSRSEGRRSEGHGPSRMRCRVRLPVPGARPQAARMAVKNWSADRGGATRRPVAPPGADRRRPVQGADGGLPWFAHPCSRFPCSSSA